MKLIHLFISLNFIFLQDFSSIIINDFAYHPFEKDINKEMIGELFSVNFDVQFEVAENKHSPGQDTIYTYSSGDSFFQFIKIPSGKTFFRRAEIKNLNFEMKGITVGMTIDQFTNYFNIDDIDNSIVILSDEAELVTHVFYFENEELISAKINMYVD